MECLPLWNKCNNRCLMCSNPPDYSQSGGYRVEDLLQRIGKINPKEGEVYLTGGEPTLHPDFLKLLSILRKKCPEAKIVLDTNGRMFCYLDFLKKTLDNGKMEFQVSLCGHNKVLFEKITRAKGSFEQTVEGIKNILALKSNNNEVEVRVVIHRLTLPHLDKIYSFVRKSFPQIERLIFIFMEYEGIAGINRKMIGVTYREARPYLEKLFSKTKKSPFEIRFYHFPLCVLSSKFWPYIWRTLPKEEVTFLSKCKQCCHREHCLGIHRDYLKYMGEEEFHPLRKIEVEESKNFYHPIIAI